MARHALAYMLALMRSYRSPVARFNAVPGHVFTLACAAFIAPAAASQHVQNWATSDPATRITEQGPILETYGKVGHSGIIEVAMCKLDVAKVTPDPVKRLAFQKLCYRLVHVSIQKRLFDSDLISDEPPQVQLPFIRTERPYVLENRPCRTPAECGYLERNRGLPELRRDSHFGSKSVPGFLDPRAPIIPVKPIR